MATTNLGDKKDKMLVAAIDFGTTYSGYAFSFKHDYQSGMFIYQGTKNFLYVHGV